MNKNERGIHEYQAERFRQEGRGEILEQIAREKKLGVRQEQNKRSKQLLQSAIDTIKQFPKEAIFSLTDSVKGEKTSREVSVYYPPEETKKDFIDQMGRITIQDSDGRHKQPIGLVNFLEKTGIGQRSEDNTSIITNPDIVTLYQNQELSKSAVY